jgi:hypothetical protein
MFKNDHMFQKSDNIFGNKLNETASIMLNDTMQISPNREETTEAMIQKLIEKQNKNK